MAQESKSARRAAAMAKFKNFALWYVVVSLPICLIIMFWPMADNVTFHGKLAHYLAVPLAFLSGLVFMSIMFFSSHSGGDEQPNYVEMMERQKRDDERARLSRISSETGD